MRETKTRLSVQSCTEVGKKHTDNLDKDRDLLVLRVIYIYIYTTKGKRYSAEGGTQLHNNIYVENNIKVKQNKPRKQYCNYDQNTYNSSLQD